MDSIGASCPLNRWPKGDFNRVCVCVCVFAHCLSSTQWQLMKRASMTKSVLLERPCMLLRLHRAGLMGWVYWQVHRSCDAFSTSKGTLLSMSFCKHCFSDRDLTTQAVHTNSNFSNANFQLRKETSRCLSGTRGAKC
eukprot:6108415-Amphidinium_carterae.1